MSTIGLACTDTGCIATAVGSSPDLQNGQGPLVAVGLPVDPGTENFQITARTIVLQNIDFCNRGGNGYDAGSDTGCSMVSLPLGPRFLSSLE